MPLYYFKSQFQSGATEPPNTRTEASFLRPKSRVKWPYHISIRFMVLSPLENGPKFPKDFQGNQKSFFLSSKVKKYNPALEKIFTVQLQNLSKFIKITKSYTVKTFAN